MQVNIPESFFADPVAIHVNPEDFEDFITSFQEIYDEKIEKPNVDLLQWCQNKARQGKEVTFMWSKHVFYNITASTQSWAIEHNYRILKLDDVLTNFPSSDIGDILTLL